MTFEIKQSIMAYRNEMILLAERLGITDEMSGQGYWQRLTDEQLAEATVRLFVDYVDSEARIVAGNGDDRETGRLDAIKDGMAVIRWDQGTVSSCPIGDIEAAEYCD